MQRCRCEKPIPPHGKERIANIQIYLERKIIICL